MTPMANEPTRRERVMLVLTRGIGEEIVIAGNIRVTVLAIKRHRIRIGITAPPSVPVIRQELLAGYFGDTGAPGNGSNGKSQEGGEA
jgi:carbon storage regulator